MESKVYKEYTAKEASERLDYILVMVKDDESYRDHQDNPPSIRVHVSECSLAISKTLAKTYIKEAFERMNREAQRVDNGEIEFMESYKPAFKFTVSAYSIWVDASPETERTAENKAKHAQMEKHRNKIWRRDGGMNMGFKKKAEIAKAIEAAKKKAEQKTKGLLKQTQEQQRKEEE